MSRARVLPGLLLLPLLTAAAPAEFPSDLRFLSSPPMAGREPGSVEERVAWLWLGTRMQAAGLSPAAGEGRWEQAVPLRIWRPVPEVSSLTLHGPALPPTRLIRDQEFVALADGEHAEVEVDGALTFVGYAVSAPEYGYDDLRGADLQGRIAVVLEGAPGSDRPNFFPPGPRAVHADPAGKMRRLAGRGAAGVIFVRTPEAEQARPWADVLRSAREEGVGWVAGSAIGDGAGGLPARAVVSWKGFERMAAAAGIAGGAAGILERAAANRLRPQEWAVKARLRSEAELRTTTVANVLGVLQGSDPARAGETVVVTTGTRGEQGARGVAMLLEVARSLASLPRRPARTVLFAALAGERRGALGASFLATHPVVPDRGIVAALDVDGGPAAGDPAAIAAWGLTRSSLGGAARQAAAATGIALSEGEAARAGEVLHAAPFAFVRQGVPALSIETAPTASPAGEGPGGPVRDDARFARFLATLVRQAADGERPAWVEGDFFARFVRPPAD